MWKEIKFAIFATKKNIQSSAELRTSFLANIFGMMLNNSAFVIIWIYFTKAVGNINGWTPEDIIGMLGFGTVAFGLVFCLGGGIVKVAEYTFTGSFDKFMLSPKNLLLRIATSAFRPSAVGDFIFGVVCLIIYGSLIDANIYQILLMFLFCMTATVALLSSVIIAASSCFLFADARTISEGIFHFGLAPSLFHGGAFQGVMRFIFTFIVPSLLFGALPAEAVKSVSFNKMLLILLVSTAWLFLSVKIFKLGVKKYESTNFMTFGN